MENQIPEQIKTERSNLMLEMDARKRAQYEEALLGNTVEVLVEERVSMNGKTVQVGHTKEYVKIAIESESNLQNQIIDVQIQNRSQIIH